VGTKIGGSTFDSSGRRHSVADLLSYAKALNMRVQSMQAMQVLKEFF